MTGQQLKNSILQMAVQGKLVPQDPNDEPASVLLERIRAEKEQLIKEGKIKKEKNPSVIFRGADNLPYEKVGKNEPICIADEVPFDIPENWEWVRFKNLVSYNMGKTPPRKESEYWENATYPWVSIADLVLDDTVCVTKERVNEHSAKVIFKNRISKAGTLLMSFKLTVGKVSILGMDAFHNEAIISIYPFCDVNRVITNYLFVTLPLLSQNGNTKTAIKGATLNSDSLDALLIPVPPIKEQIRICEKIKVLKNILSIYTNLEQSLTRLNDAFPLQLKKSILQYAVQGKLVPQDPADEPASVLLARIRAEKEQLIKAGKIKRDKHESVIFRRDNSYYEQVDGIERCIDDELPFEIPKSWEWTRLSTIAKVLGGKRIPAGRKLTAENTGHVYIRVSDMKDGTVIQNGLLYVPEDIFNSISKYIIKKEDVFITVAGTIGRIGKIPPELDGANLTENADRLVFSSLNQDWMIFLLQSSFIQNQIAEVTTKVGQPKLAIARIEKLLIPLPPLNEQTRIVEQIAVIFSQMKKL
jgi:type I restriction enzyme S subunit